MPKTVLVVVLVTMMVAALSLIIVGSHRRKIEGGSRITIDKLPYMRAAAVYGAPPDHHFKALAFRYTRNNPNVEWLGTVTIDSNRGFGIRPDAIYRIRTNPVASYLFIEFDEGGDFHSRETQKNYYYGELLMNHQNLYLLRFTYEHGLFELSKGKITSNYDGEYDQYVENIIGTTVGLINGGKSSFAMVFADPRKSVPQVISRRDLSKYMQSPSIKAFLSTAQPSITDTPGRTALFPSTPFRPSS